MSLTLRDAEEVLRKRFGLSELRPGQRRAVGGVLAGRDVLAVMPTGGGKSLCYQLPALMLDGLTVVLSPLISLMHDQVARLTERGVPAACLDSTLAGGAFADALAAARDGAVRLLFAAPERFEQGPAAGVLARARVALLAVDEAHCISEWGHEFRPSYRRVCAVRERLGAPPTIALTATATPAVQRDICAVLGLRRPDVVVTGFDRPNLRLSVRRCRTDRDRNAALRELLAHRTGPAVIYSPTRREVDRVARALVRAGQRAVAYHAGLGATLRSAAQERFMAGASDVIVATNAFGMGVDKQDVRLVIHHAMPGSLEGYYQEAGRAGRDGGAAECVLLHALRDRFTHEYFIASASPGRRVVEAVYSAARALASRRGGDLPEPAVLAAAACVGRAQIDAALSLLVSAGAVRRRSGSPAAVRVRLLGLPLRLRRELAPNASLELDLLRSLWRASRGSIATGGAVDLASLPPGLGGVFTARAMLDSLQRRQLLVWHDAQTALTLADASRPLDDWPVAWAVLRLRRRAARVRLDAMQHYAFTKRCRRAFILRYFGERPAARNCGACDNCDGG